MWGLEESSESLVDLTMGKFTFNIFGIDVIVTEAVVSTWIIMAVCIVFAIIFRLFILKRFTDRPKGFQNGVELIVEAVYKFTDGYAHKFSKGLAPYICTLGIYLTLANTIELFGLRPPTTSIGTTAALAILTFLLINIYGTAKNGVGGHIKKMYVLKPIILTPIKMVTEVAIPLSLASRLYGNILAGFIVMELIYKAMTRFLFIPFGIPAVFAIYFNLFDGLLQTLIFIILTLTYIGEQVGENE